MIPLKSLNSAPFRNAFVPKSPKTRLIVLWANTGPALAMPAATEMRGAQVLAPIVVFDTGRPASISILPNIDSPVIDIGEALFRAPPSTSAFSSDHLYSRAGNLALDSAGVWIICNNSVADPMNPELWINITTGERPQQRQQSTWYIPKWELGIPDGDGGFEKLYSWDATAKP
jgi:hypothetical protein